MLTLPRAEPRPLGIAAQHVEVELFGLIILVEVLHLTLVHDLNGCRGLCHLQRGAGRAAAHLDISHTRLLGGVLCHLEGEFLAGTACALATHKLQPFAPILDGGRPDGAR